jgi:hypothetical protein
MVQQPVMVQQQQPGVQVMVQQPNGQQPVLIQTNPNLQQVPYGYQQQEQFQQQEPVLTVYDQQQDEDRSDN